MAARQTLCDGLVIYKQLTILESSHTSLTRSDSPRLCKVKCELVNPVLGGSIHILKICCKYKKSG